MKNPAFVHAVIALILALAAAGGYVVWLSQVEAKADEARMLAGQIEEKSSTHASGGARLALEEVAAGEAFVAAHAVPADDAVSFIESLEATGRSFGAVVTIASVSDPANGRISIALSAQGSFEAVMRTIGAIEHGPFASATQSLSLDAVGDSWRATYTMQVATHAP